VSHTYPVCPEPTTPHKPPALLAVCLRVLIGCEAFTSELSCPFVGFEAFASGTGFLVPLLAILFVFSMCLR
jgi:hypothetical protein